MRQNPVLPRTRVRRQRIRIRHGLALVLIVMMAPAAAARQLQVPPTHAASGEFRPPSPSDRHRQDSRRNNLQHPPGYATVALGSLGEVVRRGTGPTPVILIPGLGAGWRIFDSLIEATGKDYTFHAITLAGFGGSSAPPMPPAGTSYVERTWLAAAQHAVRDLIRNEKLERPLVVAFYSDAANIALHLALSNAELVGGVLVLSASARFPLQQQGPRGPMIDAFARQWFRTVTEIMWPSGMYPPQYYANATDLAEKTWWTTLDPTLPTSIRYLVETWADDLAARLVPLAVPTIVLSPGFNKEFLAAPFNGQQIRVRFHDSWASAIENGSALDHRIVDGARFLLWEDQPETVYETMKELAQRRLAAAKGKSG